MVAFGRLLAALDHVGVDYVLVGGLAVGTHGFVRATKDVDVLVPAARETSELIKRLLDELDATRPDGSPLPEAWFDGEHHIRARTAFGLLDVIPEGLAPLDYATLRASAVRAEVDGTQVWVVDLPGLVTLKRLAGRPQDQEDLRRLETAHGGLPPTVSEPPDHTP